MTIFEKIIEVVIWVLGISLIILAICLIIACITGNVEMTQEEVDFIVRTSATTTVFNATGVYIPIQ